MSEHDVHGEAVNAAARIYGHAGAEEILITKTTRGAAGSGAGISYLEHEPIELKGFPDRFEVCNVDWRGANVKRRPMEQRIRFLEIAGHRIGYSMVGTGPTLVFPSPWISNLQSDWENPDYRQFVERLAEAHTVVRYDRPGTGLSDRRLPDKPGLDLDVSILEGLVERLDLGPLSLFGVSCGGSIAVGYAARNPASVESLVLVGCYVDGSRLAPEAVADSITEVIRASWGLGSRMLSDIFVSGGTEAERSSWAKSQRESADADSAADLYQLVYSYDATRAVEHVQAPALVIHRQDDAAVNSRLGRELAASLPEAGFVSLEGSRHLPWQGDSEPVLDAAIGFLAEHHGAVSPPGDVGQGNR